MLKMGELIDARKRFDLIRGIRDFEFESSEVRLL